VDTQVQQDRSDTDQAQPQRRPIVPAIVLRCVDIALGVVLAVALLGEVAVVIATIILRDLLHNGAVWSQDLTPVSLAAIGFLGGAYSYRHGAHVVIKVVVNRLPDRIGVAVSAAADWVVCLVGVLLILAVGPLLGPAWSTRSDYLHIPGAVSLLMLLVAGAALVLYAGANALERRWPALPAAVVVAVLGVVLSEVGGQPAGWQLGVTLVVMAVLLLAGVPIAFVLVLGSVQYVLSVGAGTLANLGLTMSSGVNSELFLTIPFFVLGGYLMVRSKVIHRLGTMVDAAVGHLRAGPLQTLVLLMCVFSGMCGAKAADVAAVGSGAADLVERKYPPGEIAAVLSASAVMGETIPPSTAIFVVGAVASVSVGQMLIAGILPAAVMAVVLIGAIALRARAIGVPRSTRRFSAGRLVREFGRGLPALSVPVVLVGGIVAGFASPTEVAAVSVGYVLILIYAVYGGLGWSDLVDAVRQALRSAGMVLFTIAAGSAFSQALIVANVPQAVATAMTDLGGGAPAFLALSIVVLIVAGSFLEGSPALIVFAPLLIPIATSLGINPVQYAMVLIIAMGLGSFLPPIGIGLYIASSVSGATVEESTKPMLRYVPVLVAGLLIIAFVPPVSLLLPRLVY
jgi:tripartite ATP-independent transporter DctM subunit